MLVVLCLFGASVASVAVGTVYETYDCEYFSVEYPSEWNIERSLNADVEGWEYRFADIGLNDISLTVGTDKISFSSISSLSNIEGGSLDSITQHFLDTLHFKNDGAADTIFNENIVYTSYDSMYFDVEYPTTWDTGKVPMSTLSGTMYVFADRSLNTKLAVSFGSALGGEFFNLKFEVPRSSVMSGEFDEPVQHFIDTLHFKV